jgi:Lrp/AsnC family transcriptional regulator for asnA, asnC and gidA
MKDNVNLKLLKVLLEDSSAPLHEIGRKIGVFSPSAVSRRIKEMKRKRMITSETVVFDPKKIGLDYILSLPYFNTTVQLKVSPAVFSDPL